MTIGAPDLESTVERFATTKTRRRYSPSSTTASGLKVAAYVDSTITAYIHDAPAEVIEQLPEGHEGNRTVQGYTPDELRVASPSFRGDVVIHEGASFEVIQLARWGSGSAATVTWSSFVAVQVERP